MSTQRSEAIRARILREALRLFNERGTEAVTVRHIAQAVGISHGNLCYHFANTDVLIQGLYEQLVGHLDAVFTEFLEDAAPTLVFLDRISARTMQVFYEYRFLMLDFVALMRRLEPLRTHYRNLQALRAVQFKVAFETLVSAGLLRPEPVAGQFEVLRETLIILGDFWIAESEILFEGTEDEKIAHYRQLFLAQLTPYLTEKGLEEYKAMRAGGAG